jgi:hypothetical protein
METDSSWKSERRLLRSVEMMTQRPVTGSFLSSDTEVSGSPCGEADLKVRLYADYDDGVECVSIYLNARPSSVHLDRDHVEAARLIVQTVPGQIVYGHLRDAPLLPRGERVGAAAELFPDARLDLDEHRRPGLAGNDVNFSKLRPVAAIKNRRTRGARAQAQARSSPIFPRIWRASSVMPCFWWHVPRQSRGQSWGQG